MVDKTKSLPEKLSLMANTLTRSERQVADVILENYPVSGLGAITEIAKKSNVSMPTVTRLINKLGFGGFAEFQESLRQELDTILGGEIQGGAPWAPKFPETHLLNRITESTVNNIRHSLDDLDVASFEAMCNLIGDVDRGLYIVGGRITGCLAHHFTKYMEVLRPGVHYIENLQSGWHHNVINMKAKDVLFVYDIRRYEAILLDLAKTVRKLDVEVVLITDQWKSPISSISSYCLNGRLVTPNGRDSVVSLMLFNEIIISQVQHNLGDITKKRREKLEKIFQETKFFDS